MIPIVFNFVANVLLGVGLLMIFPSCRGWFKRLALVAMSIAAVINLVDMTGTNYSDVRPGELLLNCAFAVYVVAVVLEMQQNGVPKE